ncbi:CoA pyrophosphatase [Rossellomorea vietnamensis]|uniref:CoA pyrophosphatase n=1 Tax=Rossellomorea vietnamensis TaxID=218284 RepID=A0A5D4NW31_9BACI|nr:CoA pyrophosphatase [Rossellomorea vietnamensis]TYS18109.1 CoA pyrophosphatase [Rossellomorea vietnamensis]
MNIEDIQLRFNNRTPTILGSGQYYRFSVLLPLIEINDEIHILFEVRSEQLRRQPGDICFPGGKVDESDDTEKQTAIRETCEELGIEEGNLSGIYPMDYIVSSFGTFIFPYVGILDEKAIIKPNADEVAETFTVPLSFFIDTDPKVYKVGFTIEPEEDFPLDLIAGGENYNWQTRKIDEYFYFYEDKVIWGLTAKILKHFIDELTNME